MPRRWFSLILLTAVSSLYFLPTTARGAETDDSCYVAAIESRPWNGPAGGPGAATNGAGLRGDRHGARLGDTWIQSGAGRRRRDLARPRPSRPLRLGEAGALELFRVRRQRGAKRHPAGPGRRVRRYLRGHRGKRRRIPRNGQGVFDFKAAGWKLIRPERGISQSAGCPGTGPHDRAHRRHRPDGPPGGDPRRAGPHEALRSRRLRRLHRPG